MRDILTVLMSSLAITSQALADQVWERWPLGAPGYVATGFKHDDGGSLVVMCDTAKMLIYLGLIEPRANWQPGQQMQFMTRTDTGGDVNNTVGYVKSRDQLVLSAEDTTWHLHAMGKATIYFGVGTGEYARVFPAAGFRKAVEPVLQACGDHW
jgi:hypothetical protein